MNRDDVLSAAVEAGMSVANGANGYWDSVEQLERFAGIIEQRARESEREGCAARFIDAVMCAHSKDDLLSAGVDAIRARADK